VQNIFSFIIYPMELGLVWLAVTLGNAGIGIIVFTIFVRLALSPLTITQLRNAKAMQRIQPLVKELQQKHGKDRQALSQATMELYKEHKVNPAMGCLPTLLQFPILIGLFYALLHLGQSPPTTFHNLTCGAYHITNVSSWFQHCYAIKGASGSTRNIYDLFHADFLWLSNGLGGKDPFYILPLLAGATQWVQSRMMLTRSADPQQQMMNTMMNFMPLMIIFFAVRYPSGLALYWVTSTTIGILIQYRITGWGLLADGGLPTPARLFASVRSAGSPARPKTAKQPPQPAKSTVPATEPNVDGSNGAGAKPAAVTTARPRKKANRARGGRGGRRG
jgi:YidC/Oxa1 family membrane protein insertase